MPRSIEVANGPVTERYLISNYVFQAAPFDEATQSSDPLQGSVGVNCMKEVLVNGSVVMRTPIGFGASGTERMTAMMGMLKTRMASVFAAMGCPLSDAQLNALLPAYFTGTREALYDLGKSFDNGIPTDAN